MSCGQTRCFSSGEVKARADEFHEDWGIGVRREKIRKGIAQSGYLLDATSPNWLWLVISANVTGSI